MPVTSPSFQEIWLGSQSFQVSLVLLCFSLFLTIFGVLKLEKTNSPNCRCRTKLRTLWMLRPDRDTLLDMSAKYLWVQGIQWFNGLMVQMRPWRPSRDRGQEESKESMDCQNRVKTKLRSTTDTEAILIVEGPQLIVNKRTQVRHYESYRMSWKLREQWCSAATIVTMSHGPGCVGQAVVEVQRVGQKENKAG